MLSGFSYIAAFGQTSSTPISFTKKEIVFLNWGSGENEVKLIKNEEPNIYHGIDQGGKKYTYLWPDDLKLDGNGNLYFSDWNKRVFIISPDGRSVKTISAEKTGGLLVVDEEGNIYGSRHKKGESTYFILTKPDGTQQIYKDFFPSYEENGVVYDRFVNKALTILNNGEKPEKFPFQFFTDENEIERGQHNDSFSIRTEKINKHLKKIYKKINSEKIQINIEDKTVGNLRTRPIADFMGVDEHADFYFFCKYSIGPGIEAPWGEADVMVFSQTGQKIGEIPIMLDEFHEISSGFFGTSMRGFPPRVLVMS
jgi:hypothetical protein